MKQCYLDTEFNSFDYKGQNGGLQEIVEIGAAILDDGSVVDTFQTYCQLSGNHVVTRRCTEITGITEGTLCGARKIPCAYWKLKHFLKKHGIDRVLTYGSYDQIALKKTAKIYCMNIDKLGFIKSIESIDNSFRKEIGCGHFSWSLHDLSRIFHVSNEHEHSALGDAKTLALCSWRLSQRDIDWQMVEKILKEKTWRSGYKTNRRLKEQMHNANPLDAKQISEVRKAIDASSAPDFVKDALLDDLLLICGLRPEHDNC